MNILRLVLLGLAALSWIIGGIAILRNAAPQLPTAAVAARGGTLPPQEIAAVRRTFEQRLKAAPDYAVFFDRFERRFPSEFAAFIISLAQRGAASRDIGGADLLVADAQRELRQSRGVLAAKASQKALERVFERQLAILEALAETNPHLCVDFIYGSESFSGDESDEYLEFSAHNRPLVAALAEAAIDAIHDGEVNRIARDAPTGADFSALEEALRGKGLGTQEIEALLDGKAANPPVEDGKMCRAGAVYLETLAAMPSDRRLRIYALAVELMARS